MTIRVEEWYDNWALERADRWETTENDEKYRIRESYESTKEKIWKKMKKVVDKDKKMW